MKKILKKIGLGFLFFFSFLWLYMKLFLPSTFLEAPEVLSHIYAKEICSCVFVEKLTEAECTKVHTKVIGPQYLGVDLQKKEVVAQLFYGTAKAHFVDEFKGCLVDY